MNDRVSEEVLDTALEHVDDSDMESTMESTHESTQESSGETHAEEARLEGSDWASDPKDREVGTGISMNILTTGEGNASRANLSTNAAFVRNRPVTRADVDVGAG